MEIERIRSLSLVKLKVEDVIPYLNNLIAQGCTQFAAHEHLPDRTKWMIASHEALPDTPDKA